MPPTLTAPPGQTDRPAREPAGSPGLQVPRHDECGYLGKPAKPADAARAVKLHSCDKHRRRRAAHARRQAAAAARDRTPRPCPHGGLHQHGTRSCYQHDTCRCLPCEQANNHYEAERRRRIAAGTWAPLTDAGPAAAHVRSLVAAGLPARQVAALAAVSVPLVYRLLATSRPGATGKRLRPQIADRLLAVPRPGLDGTGTRRRLQALVTIGWPPPALDLQLGEQAGWVERQLQAEQVSHATAARVAGLFERLWDRPPPQHTESDRLAAEQARARARVNGWAPPMAWDDELNPIDDPAAQPDLGEPVSRRSKLPPAEELRFLLDAGESAELVAARFGVKPGAVKQALLRDRAEAALEAGEPAASADGEAA